MTTLETKLAQLAQLKQELDKLSAVRDEYDTLKAEVLFEMQAAKSKRTEAVQGIFAVRSERTDVQITDPTKVETWLGQNGFAVEEYKRLDMTRVTPMVRTALKETGEIVPGTEVVLGETVSIRRAA